VNTPNQDETEDQFVDDYVPLTEFQRQLSNHYPTLDSLYWANRARPTNGWGEYNVTVQVKNSPDSPKGKWFGSPSRHRNWFRRRVLGEE
jgi:hypothetical protein